MIETIAAFDGRCAKVSGPARSGKTEALVQRCATLLRAGAAPASIYVEVTDSFAAQAFRRRLHHTLDEESKALADDVVVETALDACVRVLATPEAREATGRVPRLLTNAEYNFFLEDMKTQGTPIRRLRKMLDAFYEQWSKLTPDSEWMGTEEEVVRDHALMHLSTRGAMLVQEAPTRCADFLKSEAGKSARQRYDYVLCDDYQNLTYAEQTCVCLLASKQLIVAGNVNQLVPSRTKFPNAQGFAEFDTLRRGVETFTLSEAFGNVPALRMADALCAHGGMDTTMRAEKFEGSETEILSAKWNTPEEELDGITKYLRVLLDGEDVHESRTCVLVPNKRWARMAERILKKRGFEVSSAGAVAGIGGDPRSTQRAKALVAYTKLNLLADPEDLTAWRSWCGFDNALTNSDAWNFLVQFANERKMGLLEALDEASHAETEPFLRAKTLQKRWIEGQEYIAKNARRKGFTLMRAIGAEGLPEFEDVNAMLEGDEDAATLFKMVRKHAMDPAWPEGAHILHIAGYDSMTGTEYDNIFALGVIDGFMPRRDAYEVVSTEEDRENVMDEERRRFYNAVSKAKKRLVISQFSKSLLELAELTKMQVVRVKSENGARMAIVRPSVFLAEAGDAAPSTEGGQSILSRYGLN